MTRAVLLGSGLALLACAGLTPVSTPFTGGTALELELEGSHATADVDGPVLQARFEEVGVAAEAVVDAPNRVTLRLRGIDPTADRTLLLSPAVVELAFPGGEVMTNDTIADSQAREDDFGRHMVTVELTDAGRDQFCTLSGQYVEQPVAIRLDGQVMSQPVIREAICGGSVQITMGASGSNEQRMQEAFSLAAALRSTPLASTWTPASERLITD